MSKFKVGDKVRANDKSRYGITKEGWIGRVTFIKDSNYMKVKGPGLSFIADVEQECFDLVKNGITMKVSNPSLYLDSVEYTAIFEENGIILGCKKLSLEDAVAFIKKFNELYYY